MSKYIPRLNENQCSVLIQASNLWGKEFQKDMAIEECSELILAISHWRRERITTKDLLEEVADVFIVMTQLILDEDDHGTVDEVIKKKILRLQNRVNQNKPNMR